MDDDDGRSEPGEKDRIGLMPTFRQIGPYRLHFWSADRAEPPHIHVERDEKTAKFWLRPVRLVTFRHFRKPELRKVMKIVTDHEAELLRFWNERFANRKP